MVVPKLNIPQIPAQVPPQDVADVDNIAAPSPVDEASADGTDGTDYKSEQPMGELLWGGRSEGGDDHDGIIVEGVSSTIGIAAATNNLPDGSAAAAGGGNVAFQPEQQTVANIPAVSEIFGGGATTPKVDEDALPTVDEEPDKYDYKEADDFEMEQGGELQKRSVPPKLTVADLMLTPPLPVEGSKGVDGEVPQESGVVAGAVKEAESSSRPDDAGSESMLSLMSNTEEADDMDGADLKDVENGNETQEESSEGTNQKDAGEAGDADFQGEESREEAGKVDDIEGKEEDAGSDTSIPKSGEINTNGVIQAEEQHAIEPPTGTAPSNESIVCPDGNDPIPETFCGRGPKSVECNSDSYCFIDAADRFAVCCPHTSVEEEDQAAPPTEDWVLPKGSKVDTDFILSMKDDDTLQQVEQGEEEGITSVVTRENAEEADGLLLGEESMEGNEALDEEETEPESEIESEESVGVDDSDEGENVADEEEQADTPATDGTTTEGQGVEINDQNTKNDWKGYAEDAKHVSMDEEGNGRDDYMGKSHDVSELKDVSDYEGDGFRFHVLHPKGEGRHTSQSISFIAGGAALAALILCFFYCRCKRRAQSKRPNRGTYAALGSDDFFNGTFSDDISFGGKESDDDDSVHSYESDDGYGNGIVQMEMGKIHELEANGGLTLDEVNG